MIAAPSDHISGAAIIKLLFENHFTMGLGGIIQPLDSAGSQFFIMVSDTYTSSLDGQYAAFGKVIEGMEVVDAIVANKTDANDKPLVDQIIKSIRVDTKGIEYPEAEKIN